jgi:signal peptidase
MQYIKKFGKIAADVIFGLMLVAGLAMIVLRICGFRLLAVETGSMGDTCPVGSLVIVQTCQPEKIAVGDVISFVADENLVTVTHRVTDIDTDGRSFTTKGDANNTSDSKPVSFDNLIGRVRLTVPLIGYVIIWSQTTGAKAVIALAFTLIAVCTAARASWVDSKGKGRRHDPSEDKKNPQ